MNDSDVSSYGDNDVQITVNFHASALKRPEGVQISIQVARAGPSAVSENATQWASLDINNVLY